MGMGQIDTSVIDDNPDFILGVQDNYPVLVRRTHLGNKGTYAQLQASDPAGSVQAGTTAYTTDAGLVVSDGVSTWSVVTPLVVDSKYALSGTVVEQWTNGTTTTTSTNQRTQAGALAALTSVAGGTKQAFATGGPIGDGPFLRIPIDAGVNGKARIYTGDTMGGTNCLNLGKGYRLNAASAGGGSNDLGAVAVWMRFNLDATDMANGGLDNFLTGAFADIFGWDSYGVANTQFAMHENSFYFKDSNSSIQLEYAANNAWHLVMFSPTAWQAVTSRGIAAFAASTTVPYANAGRTSTLDLGPVYFNLYQRPSFTIGFDNDDATIYTNAYPYMKARGVPGQIYCDGPATIDTASHLTTAQLRTMMAAGWSVGLHGNAGTGSSTAYGSLVAADVANGYYGRSSSMATDFATLIAWHKATLGGNGWKHGAWPLGMFDVACQTTLQSLGILTMRAIGSTQGAPLVSARANFIRGYGAFATDAAPTWSTVKAAIDSTIAIGGHLDIWGHYVNVGKAIFQQMIDYLVMLRDQDKCDLLTAESRYTKYMQSSWL